MKGSERSALHASVQEVSEAFAQRPSIRPVALAHVGSTTMPTKVEAIAVAQSHDVDNWRFMEVPSCGVKT
jgi:hypothetical protein